MFARQRSARHRWQRSRAARLAVPLAIPMALGLALGAVLAFSGGVPHTTIEQAAAGDTAAPTPSASAPSASAPSASATASPAASPAATATAPAAAAANVSCDIIVPANPLSAQGLATPYQLTGPNGMTPRASGCMEDNPNLNAFVQATILDPATGKLSVYEPLVITQGTQPAAAPVVPALPRGAVVTIDFGFNGTNLTQVGATAAALRQGHCVNGTRGSVFGEVSFCNGTGFFQAAVQAEQQGGLVIPAAAVSPVSGQPCPTTRSFTLIDQDQSDNVTTQYLTSANDQTAQDTTANAAKLAGDTVISNGSDNALLNGFLDPALKCAPFTAPDLSNGGALGTSQALDELFAAKNQQAPIADTPLNDPMTLAGNAPSTTKTNLYRSNVGQPPLGGNAASDTAAAYCQNMVNIQTPFLSNNQAALTLGPTPVPAVGTNLLTFMANRLSMSFTNLGCQNFGLKNTVAVTLNGNGAATAATFTTTQQQAANTGAAAAPTPAAPTGAPGETGTRPPRAQNPGQQFQQPSARGF
jgi:hypothetical protein